MCRLNCTRNEIDNQCDGGYNDGVSLDHYDLVCKHYETWMLGAITGGFITIYISGIEAIARFSCCINSHKTLFNSCGLCKKGINYFGNAVLFYSTFVSFCLCLWSVIACFVLNINAEILVDIIISKLWSLVEWFVWSLPYFCYRYPGDKKRFDMRARQDTEDNSTKSSV